MEYIGKRISIKRVENELSIIVHSFVDKAKSRFLIIWLILWTLSGLVVLFQYFVIKDSNTKAAIIVWIGFWAYFAYKIRTAYLWRQSGKEIIKIREGKLSYKREISGKGKIKMFETDFMKNLQLVEPQENSFTENLNNSYWMIAGEKLTFDYYGKEIKFGIQLNEADAKALLKVIKKEIQK
jgi:hypothetical protein